MRRPSSAEPTTSYLPSLGQVLRIFARQNSLLHIINIKTVGCSFLIRMFSQAVQAIANKNLDLGNFAQEFLLPTAAS
jgi:hypothetical protein